MKNCNTIVIAKPHVGHDWNLAKQMLLPVTIGYFSDKTTFFQEARKCFEKSSGSRERYEEVQVFVDKTANISRFSKKL